MDLGLPLLDALEDARQREGATAERLARRMEEDPSWRVIAGSPFTNALEVSTGLDPASAWVTYMRQVARRLTPEDSVLVDMVLRLRIQANSQFTDADYEQFLDGRRAAAVRELNRAWPSLGLTVARLRGGRGGGRERESFQRFAMALNHPTPGDISACGGEPANLAEFLEGIQVDPRPPKVVVLGLAVMDMIFRIPSMPEPGTSVQADQFAATPGGKGLTQAVACSRLGMETALISVVGDDQLGVQIKDFLARPENAVRSDLLLTQGNASSAVTGVITSSITGIGRAIGWKNEQQLRLTRQDLQQPDRLSALDECDFLLVTFELPSETVEWALDRVKRRSGRPAVTIVTPAPPYERTLFDPEYHRNVDFVVANRWEITEFARLQGLDDEERADLKNCVRVILTGSGIGHVIVADKGQCSAYNRENLDNPTIMTVPSMGTLESAGERDAFCAMLAMQLHLQRGDSRSLIDVLEWSTAAMSKARRRPGSVPGSMPRLHEVAEIMQGLHATTITESATNP